jgi:hypothetical protein
MRRTAMRKPKTLPSRFPIGTKFVIEGRPAGAGEVQVFKRYIEFPDGTMVRLPRHPAKSRTVALRRARNPVIEPARPRSH